MESEMDASEPPKTNGDEVPQSSNSKTEDLKKTPGTKRKIQQQGDLYEVNFVALLFLRAVKSRKTFYIVSNVSAAGSFDDVVLRLGDHSIFLQLKHREVASKETPIKLTHFAYSNDFNFSKYLESYLKIKRQWQKNQYGLFEKSLFVVYTNARISECLVNDLGDSELLAVVSSGGKSIFLEKLFENLSKYRTTLYNAVQADNITNPEILEAVNALSDKNARQTPGKEKLKKLLSEVDALLALPDYQKFISQYYFCGEQASQKKLVHYIKEEMHTVCGTDRLFKELIEGVKKWWESPKVCYLKENVEFWKKILGNSIANLEKKYPKLNIKFDEKYLETIRGSLSDNSRILIIKTACISLASLKASQSLAENFVVDSATLDDARLTEVLALWKLRTGRDVLIVESDSLGEEVIKEFADVLKLFPEKKLLIISTGHKPLVVDLLEQFGVACISDNVSLEQFDKDSQTQLLETKVVFQGKPVELKSLADESFLKGAVSDKVLEDLVMTDKESNIGNKIFDEEHCYIPRTFIRQEFVDEGIFKNRDIYVAVTGMSLDELKRLVPSTEKVGIFDVNSLTKDDSQSRVIIINSYDDYKQLCKSHNNIHWIQKCSEGFVWKHSKGNMTALEDYFLEGKNINYSSIEEIVKLPQQIVLIVAEPGMGKSTELTHIGHVLKPPMWIIRVDLSRCTKLLKRKEKISGLEFLKEACKFKTEFERSLFEHQVHNEGNVAVQFDSFDEISPYYTNKVIELLKDLVQTKIKKIFVASRPTKRKKLEHEFSVLSFSLLPFTKREQEYFLEKFWGEPDEPRYPIKNFIERLLDCSKKSVVDVFNIGIPLETVLLAKVFCDDAWNYYETGVVTLPHSLRTIDLYKRFVNQKSDFYCQKYDVEPSSVFALEHSEVQLSTLQKKFIACALVTLLDDNIDNLENKEEVLQINNEFLEKIGAAGSQRTGIISEVVNDKAVFVHRTFAEYFAGLWLSEHIDFRSKSCKRIYKNKNYGTVRSFCDSFLAENQELHLAVLESDVSGVERLLGENNIDVNSVDKGGRTALHLSIMYCYEFDLSNFNKLKIEIAKILLEKDADINIKDNIFHQRPLQLAQEVEAFALMELLLEKGAKKKDIVLRKFYDVHWSMRKTFRVATIRGFIHSLIDLLKQKEKLFRLNEILKHVISNGYVNLTKFFLECGIKPERKLDYGFPLLGQAVSARNIPTARLLLEHGASVNARGNFGLSPFSIAVLNNHKVMVKFLLDYQVDIETRSGLDENTALMNAVREGFVEIAEILIGKGADVNARNNLGETALCIARQEQNEQMVELLLNNGAQSTTSDTPKDLVRENE